LGGIHKKKEKEVTVVSVSFGLVRKGRREECNTYRRIQGRHSLDSGETGNHSRGEKESKNFRSRAGRTGRAELNIRRKGEGSSGSGKGRTVTVGSSQGKGRRSSRKTNRRNEIESVLAKWGKKSGRTLASKPKNPHKNILRTCRGRNP